MKNHAPVTRTHASPRLFRTLPGRPPARGSSHALPSQATLDHFAQMARDLLGVPVAGISLVDSDLGLRTSSTGLTAPMALLLSFPYCRRMLSRRLPLVVEDARFHPLMADSPAGTDGTVRAFLGVPLTSSDGRGVGSVFAMAPEPRSWTLPELGILTKLATLIVGEMEFGAAMRQVSTVGSSETN